MGKMYEMRNVRRNGRLSTLTEHPLERMLVQPAMSKSSAAANVVDLSAFRQKKQARSSEVPAAPTSQPAMMMPVWVCWVPVWAPVMT